MRRAPRLFALGLAAVLLAAGASTAPAATSSKLRSDLAALVAGQQTLDPRVAQLVPGYTTGELPYFAVLSEPDDATHQAAVTALGARILRVYRSVDAFALASSPAVVGKVAALPWVSWLAPIELVRLESSPQEVDQSRATTVDVGAPAVWNQGITGTGVKIAVLDTGLDTAHPDLDDLDFRKWGSVGNPPKVVDSRNFVGGGCLPGGTQDGHGHGTHVAGIATGTGEGTPVATDDGKYIGIAPDAQLAVGKVVTDAGTGLNSDLVAGLEWAAMPADPSGCSIGADVVNISLGTESRPVRLNTDADTDFVGYVLDRLAVKYGTLFVAAAGNSGPFLGSVLESPGAAAQALTVGAAAKDYDVNHDDTLSGDTCAGWLHPRSSSASDNDCSAGIGTQPPSVSSFSSRGPSGDVWLKPDLVAPGYNIVSAQASTGAAIASNDINKGTRLDPLYATASGTSMAAPATAGSAALVLQAYRAAFGKSPSGNSGLSGLTAPAYALVRAALTNTATSDLYESRWILSTDAQTKLDCSTLGPLLVFCQFAQIITDAVQQALGSITLYEVRNRASDPFVGPLAEGAGKLQIGRAIAALRDGVVAYSAATGSGVGHRELQGSWEIGAVDAGKGDDERFVLQASPTAGPLSATFTFDPGHPSDGSTAIPAGNGSNAWSIKLPGRTNLQRGGSAVVKLSANVPSNAPAGIYSGAVVVHVSNGQTLRLPVFASVALHDPNTTAGNAPGPQARIASADDVFGKDDTSWPSVEGTPGTGSNADWLVYPVDLGGGLGRASFSVYDADRGDETYDLYLYGADFGLVASTHPFATAGVTDVSANQQRGPSTQAAPQVLTIQKPAAGRYYVVVDRARIGGTNSGDFGAFVLSLDEAK